MINSKKIIAVIPARSGSKRLKNKNILDLNGKPLIAWTIEEAKKSMYLDDVIVSTDSQEIADISKNYGALVPFLRPAELSNDTANTYVVIEHAITFLEKILNKKYDYVMLLQATSPLRIVTDIDNAIKNLIEKKANAIVSVCKLDHSLEWCSELPDDLSMKDFAKKINTARSQDLKIFYRLNGAVYISLIKKYMKEKTFFLKDNIYAYLMPYERSIDIDTKFDFDFTEYILKLQNKS